MYHSKWIIFKILFICTTIPLCCCYFKSKCTIDQFECNNKKCINRSWRCDSENDCEDNSDEVFCNDDAILIFGCPNLYFQCSQFHCIPLAWKCDGIKDCENNLDEHNCVSNYCDAEEKFNCNNGHCISPTLKCNSIDDCKDGSDEENCYTGIEAINGTIQSRMKGIAWLQSMRQKDWGWNKETHRALIALYLSNSSFDEASSKQLEVQLAIAMLRNNSHAILQTQLALYINALLVICKNPYNFYGLNLVEILKRITGNSEFIHPLILMTLCCAGEKLTQNHIEQLVNIVNGTSEFPFWKDLEAMATMALVCSKNRGQSIDPSSFIRDVTSSFKSLQNADGSFGNIYTTALVMQALFAAGHEEKKDWNLDKAAKFLMSHQKENGSFGDFLATYLVLPVLSGNSLLNISTVSCLSKQINNADNITSLRDVKNKLGPKIYLQYSLWIGTDMDIAFSMTLRIPANITFFDVMRLAAEHDDKYLFQWNMSPSGPNVYAMNNISVDPEIGMYWQLYVSSLDSNSTAMPYNKGLHQYIPENGDHAIMWYRTAPYVDLNNNNNNHDNPRLN